MFDGCLNGRALVCEPFTAAVQEQSRGVYESRGHLVQPQSGLIAGGAVTAEQRRRLARALATALAALVRRSGIDDTLPVEDERSLSDQQATAHFTTNDRGQTVCA